VSRGQLVIWVALAGAFSSGLTAAQAGELPAPPTTVPPSQIARFPALRGPAVEAVPRPIATAAQSAPFAVNAALARKARINGHTWYVIPGVQAVCLSNAAGVMGCARETIAGAGGLWLQFIRPTSGDPNGPVAQGDPVRSDFVGVLPAGVDGITAVAADGHRTRGRVANGLFVVAGTDVKSIRLHRRDLLVTIPRPR
jgi:hypothetical protein